MIILDSLIPVFVMVVLGIVLKQTGMTHQGFLDTADRLIYFLFFPALLFWKIGGAGGDAQINWVFIGTVLSALGVMFVISLLAVKILGISDFQAGSFAQSCYRFNTYIGMAVTINALGPEGVREFGILIGFAIPVINVIAVATLIWHGDHQNNGRRKYGMIAKALISNPLILGCLGGLAYAATFKSFVPFVENTFRLMSMVTLPLALLSIGGALTFKSLKGNMPVSLAAAFLKLVCLPLCGYFLMRYFGVTGIHFKVGMIFLCLPTSTALYVLSSQLNSDTQLASAAIVVSTVLSFLSLSVALVL